jgi:hypothetical protein
MPSTTEPLKVGYVLAESNYTPAVRGKLASKHSFDYPQVHTQDTQAAATAKDLATSACHSVSKPYFVALEEVFLGLAKAKASSTHTYVLHQAKVLDLGADNHDKRGSNDNNDNNHDNEEYHAPQHRRLAGLPDA